jgi:hypothetical protein
MPGYVQNSRIVVGVPVVEAAAAPAADHTTAIISEQTLNWFVAEDDSVILSEE